MKFVLFVEGKTERAICPFIQRWLHAELKSRVGIQPVKFNGWHQQYDDTPKKAMSYLNSPGRDEILAVISLLDLYGPTIYPVGCHRADERFSWGKAHIESRVNHPKFKHFFAVHELEAWLLSDPSIFPRDIQRALSGHSNPEAVNFDTSPAKLLDDLFQQVLDRTYKKVTNGKQYFDKLDPKLAASKCPYLRELLVEMKALAIAAGIKPIDNP